MAPRQPPLRLDAGPPPCLVRPWCAGDKPALLAHADNRRIWLNLRDVFPHPYDAAAADAWLAYVAERDPQTSFAIEVEGAAVGGIGLLLGSDVHRFSAEIGYWLGEAVWGRGIATAAVRALTPWAFETFGLQRIWAGVFASNAASMRVLEKAGYTREGTLRRAVVKDGEVLDQVLYARLREGRG